MKNVIKIRVNSISSPDLEISDTGTNEICVNVTGSGEGACLEIFRGSSYGEKIELMEAADTAVPGKYCDDGGICRFRYRDKNVISGFFHIVGDESRHGNLILTKKSSAIFFVGGTETTEKDYAERLAKLIRDGTKKDSETCYKVLRGIEDEFNRQLVRLGAYPGQTVSESVDSLKNVEEKKTGGMIEPEEMTDYYACMILMDNEYIETTLREVEEWP